MTSLRYHRPTDVSIAQVSEEDCGAVDSFQSFVPLWREKQGTSARLFGKREHSMTVFTVGHDPRLLGLEWKDARTLIIRYPNDSRSLREFRCQSRSDDVQIECIAYTPDYSKPAVEMPPCQKFLVSMPRPAAVETSHSPTVPQHRA